MPDDSATTVSLTVNGIRHTADVAFDTTLVELLREDLSLYGCRETCGIGVCGTCTVLLNGRAVSACLTFAFAADGGDVATAEGLAVDGLHPVQVAMIEEQAFQCSFCTPGFVVSIAAMLAERERLGLDAEPPDLESHLSGHLCRCGCYLEIAAAATRVAGSGAIRPGERPSWARSVVGKERR